MKILFAVLSGAVALQQVGDMSWLTAAEHMTLTGALVMAVIVLWRSLDKKDVMLLEAARSVTAALSASATANAELRKVIEESVEAKNQLRMSVDSLRLRIDVIPLSAPCENSVQAMICQAPRAH